MKKKYIQSALLALFVLCCPHLPLFAIDAYVTVIYRSLDVAFINHSEKELDGILSTNNEDANYYLIENYTMKKIRRLVVDEDYDFANQAVLVVIDNNLENMEAVELYSTISSALQKQEEQKQQKEQQRQAELAKFEAEKQRQKAIAEKQYISVETEEGKHVYVRGKNEQYTSMFWSFRFGMFDGMIINDTENDYNSFRYGISGDFTYEYAFDALMIGFDVGGAATIIPFTNNDGTMLGDISIIPKIGFNNFSKKLSLRAGFSSVITMKSDSDKDSTLHETIFSPAFGLGLNHINLGSAVLSMNADYLLGHLAYEDLKLAMQGGFNLAIPVATMDKVKVDFNLGVKDTVLVKEEGIENRARIIIGIGAGNVFK